MEELDRSKARGLGKLQAAVAIPRHGGAEGYRPPQAVYARLQWLGRALIWLGLSPRGAVTLDAPGRRSSVVSRIDLARLDHEGQRYMFSMAGQAQGVRNLGAAGGWDPKHASRARR